MVGISHSHDDVIEDFDFKNLASSDKIACDFDVRFRWYPLSAYAATGIMLSGVSAVVRPQSLGKQLDVRRTIADTLPLN